MGVSVPPVPSYQANPWVAAIMGLLRGGLQGHAMDVSTREHTADRLAKQQAAELAQRRQAALDESTLALNKARVDEAVARSRKLLEPQVTPSKPVLLVGEDGTPVFVDPTNPQLPEGFRVRGASPPAPRNIDPLSREGIDARIKLAQEEARLRAQGQTGANGSVIRGKASEWQIKDTPEGTVRVNKVDGRVERVLAPGESGEGAQLQPRTANPLRAKAIENRKQLSTLDEAIRELKRHPEAIGTTRGIPLVGDWVNQRWNPEGVNARAALADIGSMQLHERSGAAVTAAEWPRLAPFIPKVTDTAEAALKKLLRMRAIIEEETNALDAGGVSAPAGPAGGGVADKYGIQPTRR